MYRDAPLPATSSRLLLISLAVPRPRTPLKKANWQLKGLVAPALVVLILFLPQPGRVFAQQTSADDPGWAQNDQYAPNQQSEQQSDYGQQPEAQRPYPDSDQTYPQQGYGQAPAPVQPLNAAQLEQLVAPIALYPDPLVAQVLAASTYPGQVADADHWREMQGYASPEQIAAAADAQNWDPSVKGLTAFPRVLAQMDRNLQWTSALGNAYYNQPQDVLEAVQVMRGRARTAGTLQSTPEQAVNYDQGYIQLMPVNPQVVYVPTYNPWTVYGDQVSPYPGFSLLGGVESFLGSSPIEYGLGIAISAFTQAPWGWLAWGLNWMAQSVLFNESDYYSHSTSVADWGFRHDGMRAFAGRGGFARQRYGRTSDGFRRFGGGYNGNHGQGFRHAAQRSAESWRGNSNGGFRNFGGGYNRTSRQASNRMRSPENWRQFGRNGSGSSWNRGAGQGYRARMGATYRRSRPTYRTPTSGFQRSQFGRRSSGAFASRDFARSGGKSPHSSGLHLFGGGHGAKSFSGHGSGGFHMGGGGHAPKSFRSGGGSFGGGHSHGGGGHSGGHSGGHGGGKHHR